MLAVNLVLLKRTKTEFSMGGVPTKGTLEVGRSSKRFYQVSRWPMVQNRSPDYRTVCLC
jgi:hypothetical protein